MADPKSQQDPQAQTGVVRPTLMLTAAYTAAYGRGRAAAHQSDSLSVGGMGPVVSRRR